MTPSSQSFFISVVVQAILHGIYVATLLYCLRWLVYDEKWCRRKINWPMLITSVVVFLLSTVDLGIRFWALLGPSMAENETALRDLDDVTSVSVLGCFTITWLNNEYAFFHRVQ